jgi:hypothetical protein
MWGGRNGGLGLLIKTLFLLSAFGDVFSRVIDDLQVSAAEPRPVFAELPKHPVIQSLPLVYEVGTPLSDASEKVEKVLRTPLAFSYNKKKANGDSAPDATIVEFYGQDRLAGDQKLRSNLEYEDRGLDGAGGTAGTYKNLQDYTKSDEGLLAEKAKALAQDVKVVWCILTFSCSFSENILLLGRILR